jgi:outer membrane immunogenic protein
VPVAFTTDGNHKDGYTVGAGLEYMFAPNGRPRSNTSITISAAPPSPADRPTIVGSRFRDDEHTVKAGINYRFGWGGPVAARY